MTRRSVTLAAAGLIIVALIAIAALFSVPYVIYSPGPVEDTLGDWDGEPVVQIEGAETYPTDGRLDLTTVQVTSADAEIDLLSAFRAWLDPDQALVPRELQYPPGQTAEESRQLNQQMLARSQENAKAVALRARGYEVPATVVVDGIEEGRPADGALEVGDVIVEVDGSEITTPQDVVDAITAHDPGDEVEFVVRRDGEEVTFEVGTVAAEEDGRPLVGFFPAQSFDFPVDIGVNMRPDIGGPSAGMIFTLAFYDVLTPGELLDGNHVAGTGEIAPDGDVGPIGGIAQKIAAASSEGADVFLAPVENCDEAGGAPNGDMPVVPVDTFDDAVAAVEQVASGDVDDLPSCPSS